MKLCANHLTVLGTFGARITAYFTQKTGISAEITTTNKDWFGRPQEASATCLKTTI